MTKQELSPATQPLDPVDVLRNVVSKWVLWSKELGCASPFKLSELPLVAEDGTQLTLHTPARDLGEPEIGTDAMGYRTSALATMEEQGVFSSLYITPKYITVLSSKDEKLVKPPIEPDAFLKLVLGATVQKPE